VDTQAESAASATLEVIKPGLLRVQGYWPSDAAVVIITDTQFSSCSPNLPVPFSMAGAGESTVFQWAGPVTMAIFGYPTTTPAVLGQCRLDLATRCATNAPGLSLLS
jgi:hypothetical protein